MTGMTEMIVKKLEKNANVALQVVAQVAVVVVVEVVAVTVKFQLITNSCEYLFD